MSKRDKKMFEIVEKNIDKEVEKKLKIKGYDLISFYNVKENGKQETNEINIPMELTYKKYKVVRIENEEIKEEIESEYKDETLTFKTKELGDFAVYGKNIKKMLIFPIILLATLFLGFGAAYSINPEFKDKIDEVFINTFKIEKPTAPVITGGSENYVKEGIIKIKKDAKSYSGISYYEYCISSNENMENCEWKRTTTKNALVSTTGEWYVAFRGVSNNGEIGEPSNIEKVRIDNSAPVVKEIITEVIDGKIKVTVTSEDDLKINKYYKVDDEEYKKLEEDTLIENLNDGKEHKVTIKVEDELGNVTEVIIPITPEKFTDDITPEIPEEDNQQPSDDNNEDNNDNDFEGTNDEDKTSQDNQESSNENDKTDDKEDDKKDEDEEENEKEELIAPQINLDKVPVTITYKEKYDLPSYYKFDKLGGSVECKVRDEVVTNTEELTFGKHLIICTAKGNNGLTTIVSKEVEVKVEEGEEEIWDGWIKLNLHYPDNSTNWQWRLGKEGSIRTGQEDDGWEDYTGPILVKLSDVENVYIRYDLNGETVIVSPSKKALVDIQPEAYTLKSGEKTKVKIVYDENASKKEYRVASGDWQEYTNEFEVEANTIIEARVTKNEKVYDSEGNYVYTKKITTTDAVWIGEYRESIIGGTNGSVSYTTVATTGGTYITTPVLGSKPSTYLAGPIITSNPSEEIVESTQVTVTPQEVADKIYVSVGNGAWQEYTSEIEVNYNTIIKAYYIRYEDGMTSDISYYYVQNIKQNNKPYVRINATPSNYLTETQESVEVTISGSEYDTLEYSLDGVIYETYTSPIKVEESSTVYARGINAYGETVESLTIVTTTAPKEKENLVIHIEASPDKEEVEGLVNETEISINYDPKATKKYYKLGYYGEWIEYTGAFKVKENTTIYAYCTSDDGVGNALKKISYLTTGISTPIINVSPSTKTQYVKVEIEYDENAEIMRYQIGNGPLLDYVGPFYVEENTTITAYNKNVLGYEAESKYSITNIVPYPEYVVIDKGKYFIIKLNYPSYTSEEEREYKWKQDGTWKVYDQKGILLIKPQYKDEIMSDIKDGIQVEDANGNKIIFTDHYYLIDVSTNELTENIFMRWSSEKISAPQIYVSPEEPTKEVEVGIVYSSSLKEKYYKIVYEDGSETNWIKYTGPFIVDKQNTIIYAKGITINGNDSNIGSKKITNVDTEAPEIEVKGIFDIPRQKVNVTVSVKDNMKVETIKWAQKERKEEYFKDNGTGISNNTSFTVSENGKYTIYATDAVGNTVIKVIEVTNIDKNAPDIFIDVLTEKYGTEAEVSIDYGDSITKQYRIGETSTTYKEYTENIVIKSNDVLDLVNEDGSLTIYAKGTDEAGNEKEVKELIYVLDLDAPEAPVIQAASGYPILTEYGVKLTDKSYITYDATRDDIINYYSIDKGETWIIYTGPFEITSGEIWAKSVKKESGLTISSTKKVEMPADALGVNAYDGKENVSTGDLTIASIINVDKTMQGKTIYLYGRITKGVNYILEDGTITSVSGVGSNSGPAGKMYKLPENIIRISFPAYSPQREASDVYEISVYSMPVINNTKFYPTLTEYGVEQGYNKVEIDYFPTSVERLYRINEGEWKNYEDKTIRLELGDVIESKGIDKYGIETEISSYTAVLPADALGVNAYDGKENVSTGDLTIASIINVDKTMQGKTIYLYGRITKGVNYILEDGTITSVSGVGSNSGPAGKTYKLPENIIRISFPAYSPQREASDVYEITPYSIPVIKETKYYPTLTEYGVEAGYNKVTINYFQTSVERLYRINEGEWKSYQDKSIRLELGDIIEAKGIDKFGKETEISSYKGTLPTDALGVNAYDGKENTSTGDLTRASIINVDESMQGKTIYLYGRITKGVNYILKDGTTTTVSGVGSNGGAAGKTYELPEDIIQISFPAHTVGQSASDVYEITPYSIPVIKETKYYPTLTEYGVEAFENLSINYLSYLEQKIYSLDEGNTWKEYEDNPIKLDIGKTILAKGVYSDGSETEILSYTANNVLEDAIGVNAYDNDMSTRTDQYGKMYIDKSMYNKKIKLYVNFNCSGGGCVASNTVYFKLKDDTEVTQTITFYGSWGEIEGCEVIIPENAEYMEFKTNTYDWYNLYEINIPTTPVISQSNTYPQLSTDEFKDSKYKVKINYLSYFEQKLYSLDNGETWNQYTKEIEVNVGDVIKAKAIDKDGAETEVATYTVTAISDVINLNAHDDNYTSIDTIAKNSSKSFNITNDTVGRMLRLYLTTTPSTTSNIKVYDSLNNELETMSLTSKVTIFEVPENASKITINSGSSELSISEINLRPILEDIKVKTPEITMNDANWSESKTVEITYASGYTNEYSVDSGNIWKEYTKTFEITEPTTIIARSVDEDGKVVSSSSFVITKIDNTDPTIELNIPDEIVVGSKYDLPTTYEVGISGGSTVCKIGEQTVTSTKDLSVGEYVITCTVTTGAGKEKSIIKTLKINKQRYMDETYDLTVGQAVTAKDGSKWHVLESSAQGNETVVLLSDYNLNSDGSYNTECIGESGIVNTYKCSPMVFDSDNTSMYNEEDSNNVGYFVKNTYKPLVTEILSGTTDVTIPTAEQLAKINEIEFNSSMSVYALEASWYTTTNYWLKTPSGSRNTVMWFIDGYSAYLSNNHANVWDAVGVRPVITTLKTNLLK